jgi:molybdenum cofactor synthesis domain-containing protein
MSAETATPVEIVAVGRELLTGHTVDTNSAWLAARLTALGAHVTRIVTVDDDPAAIACEIDGARARGAALVVTTGGLGPTDDDRTLAGVAAALGRAMVAHPAALAFVARRYAELAAQGSVADAAMTPARTKMATLPAGAMPLDNPVGTAPGVLVNDGALTLIALPGVPAEMRGLFEVALPHVRARLGDPRHVAEREVASGLGDESLLVVAMERVLEAVPGVYLKSLATAFAPDCDLRVRITTTDPDADRAEARVAAAAERLAIEIARLTPAA